MIIRGPCTDRSWYDHAWVYFLRYWRHDAIYRSGAVRCSWRCRVSERRCLFWLYDQRILIWYWRDYPSGALSSASVVSYPLVHARASFSLWLPHGRPILRRRYPSCQPDTSTQAIWSDTVFYRCRVRPSMLNSRNRVFIIHKICNTSKYYYKYTNYTKAMERQVSGVFSFYDPHQLNQLNQEIFGTHIFDVSWLHTPYAHIILRWLIDHPDSCLSDYRGRLSGANLGHKNTSARIHQILLGHIPDTTHHREYQIWNQYDLHEEYALYARDQLHKSWELILEGFLRRVVASRIKIPHIYLQDLLEMSLRVGMWRSHYHEQYSRLWAYDSRVLPDLAMGSCDLSYQLSQKWPANAMLWILAPSDDVLARFVNDHSEEELLSMTPSSGWSTWSISAWRSIVSSAKKEPPISSPDLSRLIDEHIWVIHKDQILFLIYARPEVRPVGVDMEICPGSITLYFDDPYTCDDWAPQIEVSHDGVYISLYDRGETLSDHRVSAIGGVEHARHIYWSISKKHPNKAWGWDISWLLSSYLAGSDEVIEELLSMLAHDGTIYWAFLDAHMRLKLIAKEFGDQVSDRIVSMTSLSWDIHDFIARVEMEFGYLITMTYPTLKWCAPSSQDHIDEMMRTFFHLHPQVKSIATPDGYHARIP